VDLKFSTFDKFFYPHFKLKLAKCYTWIIALCGAETSTIRKVDQKYLESLEMWCWRKLKISWTDRVRNEVLHTGKGGGISYIQQKKGLLNWSHPASELPSKTRY
jgi:hypothetical protein